ncbi:MAG: nucleoside hydrolase [Parvularculaceae bacterium]
MPRTSIIIDCDPGQDDAVNLLLAFASREEFDIRGVTAVAGNAPLDMTQRNGRIIADIAGVDDVKVFAGCARPMARDLVTAHEVHGATGIDGVEIFEPKTPLQPDHAVDFIVDALDAAEEDSITLVPTGPLTNIAMALDKAPSIASKIHEVVLMGGAMKEGGNFSPSAEFNIFVDPHAAQIVLACGRPITMFGLDVTHQVLCTPARLETIRILDNAVAEAVYGMLTYFNRHDTEKYESNGAPLHDPCTIAYLLRPSLFETKRCNVEVETSSALTIGHTAVDFWHVTDRPKNVNWAHSVDADGFFELLTERLARYGR